MKAAPSSPRSPWGTAAVRPAPSPDLPLVGGGDPVPTARALVLGGGGAAGNAWLVGVVAGLAKAGLDVTDADLLVGTSAGATAAAQLLTTGPAALYEQVLAAPPLTGPRGGGLSPAQVADHMERTGAIMRTAAGPADMRRRLGAAALELDTASDGSGSARWRATVAARLPQPGWPERRLLVTAIDAVTGEPVVFDHDSGVDVVDAVAASTSNGFGVPPYAVGGRWFLDGGYRRNENADLAAGHGIVLVLSPLGGRTRTSLEWGMQLAAQADELRAAGSRVDTVGPDDDALAAFGPNLMDLSRRVPAARAGHAQGRALAEELAELWG